MTASAAELAAYQDATGERRADGADLVDPELRRDAASRRRLARTGYGDDWLRIGGLKFFARRLDGREHGGVLRALCRRSGHARAADPRAGAARAGDLSPPMPLAFSSSCTRLAIARTRSCSTSSRSCTRRAARGRGWRPRIEHAQVVRPDDMRALQAARRDRVDSAQPLHRRHALGRGAHRPRAVRTGLQRPVVRRRRRARSRSGPTGSSRRSTRCSGSTPPSRASSRTGRRPTGWFPEQRITLAQAVECYTHGSAYAEFAEHRKGRLDAGLARRPRRPVARHLRDRAARDPRHASRC